MPRRRHVAIFALSLALAANACGGATSASGSDAGSATDAETALDATALDATDTPDTAPVVPACTQAQRDARYRSTITKPIIPHKSFEGIDLFGASMHGVTLAEVEVVLCPGDPQGDLWGDGTQVMGWGPNPDLFRSRGRGPLSWLD